MDRPPRNPGAPILDRMQITRVIIVGLIILIGAFGLFEYEINRGASVQEARTVAVNVVIFVELFYLFNARSLTRSPFQIGFFSNPWVFAGAAAMILLQLLFTYTPFMNTAFNSAPIGAGSWLRILAAGFMVTLIVGIEKGIVRRRPPVASP